MFFRSLIVPLDGFPFGEHALPLAISVASRAGASIKLVHVCEPALQIETNERGAANSSVIAEDDTARAHGQAYLDSITERARSSSSVPMDAVLIAGRVADSILEEAARDSADMVVLTTHGRGPLSRFWLGSVADELARRAPIPILLIRPREGQDPDLASDPILRRILIPLDGSSLAEQIIEPALALGALMEAEFRLVRVVPPRYDYTDTMFLPPKAEIDPGEEHRARVYLDRIREQIENPSRRVELHVETGVSPAEVILREAERHRVDLIAIATRGRGGLARQFLGSVADKVVRGASIPVLLHRPHA